MNKTKKGFFQKAFMCGSPWGIGIYKTKYGEEMSDMYGFPPHNMNPHDFCPDYGCCTEKEILNWEKAKVKWDETHNRAGS